MRTEQIDTEKFKEWFAKEKALGLVDIRFAVGDVTKSTTESFCAEVNRMLEAEVLEDPDLF